MPFFHCSLRCPPRHRCQRSPPTTGPCLALDPISVCAWRAFCGGLVGVGGEASGGDEANHGHRLRGRGQPRLLQAQHGHAAGRCQGHDRGPPRRRQGALHPQMRKRRQLSRPAQRCRKRTHTSRALWCGFLRLQAQICFSCAQSRTASCVC